MNLLKNPICIFQRYFDSNYPLVAHIATHRQTQLALRALVPLLQEIRLGPLRTGIHQLKFVSDDGTYLKKKLTIN
jgi:hypothetical protein